MSLLILLAACADADDLKNFGKSGLQRVASIQGGG